LHFLVNTSAAGVFIYLAQQTFLLLLPSLQFVPSRHCVSPACRWRNLLGYLSVQEEEHDTQTNFSACVGRHRTVAVTRLISRWK